MKQRTSSTRRRFSKQQRANWLARYQASGLTQKAFAAQHGIKLSTLVRWVAKQRRRLVAGPASFIELPLEQDRGSENWVAELTWPSGLRVRLGAGAPKSWFKSFLKGGR